VFDLPGVEVPDFEFLCEATTVPEVDTPKFDIHYMGRQIRYSGDKKYPDAWTVTVINEEGNPIRGQFERWFELNNGTLSGVRDNSMATSLDYKGRATVIQQTQTGDEPETAQYICDGLFPVKLGAMDLKWSQTNEYQTFDVTFTMDWWGTQETIG
jgi:hypothetical protein